MIFETEGAAGNAFPTSIDNATKLLYQVYALDEEVRNLQLCQHCLVSITAVLRLATTCMPCFAACHVHPLLQPACLRHLVTNRVFPADALGLASVGGICSHFEPGTWTCLLDWLVCCFLNLLSLLCVVCIDTQL